MFPALLLISSWLTKAKSDFKTNKIVFLSFSWLVLGFQQAASLCKIQLFLKGNPGTLKY